MCYKVSVYNKSNKQFATYDKIHTINCVNGLGDVEETITGEDMLTHTFLTGYDYQLLSDTGNYAISSSVIGTMQVEKVVY